MVDLLSLWSFLHFDTLFLFGIALTLFFLLTTLTLVKDNHKNLPPGPKTLPILGNLHQVLLLHGGNMIKFLEKSRLIYGNIYTIEFGGVKRVVVSGFKAMQILLEKNADFSSGRSVVSMPESYRSVADVTPGLLWSPFPHWKTIRSFALGQLRDEGMGKSSLEPKILTEVNHFAEHFIEPNLGKPVDISKSIGLATANVISGMIFGTRSDYNDENFLIWIQSFETSVNEALRASIFKNIPLARYLPGDITGIRAHDSVGDVIIPHCKKQIEQQKSLLDGTQGGGSFITRFLSYAIKATEKREDNSCFTDGNLVTTCLQLYGAGMETTATAVNWLLLYMCLYPNIQEKVRREIDDVIGQREIKYNDRFNLPYTEAVVKETLRLANIAPTALPHTLDRDTVLDGQYVPAGTDILLNMASVLYDKDVFKDPHEFNPDRFLTGDTDTIQLHYIPFGIGRRACLGKDLAKMELFMFFASLMQKFQVSSPPDEVPSDAGVCTLVHSPKPYRLIFTSRD